MSIGYACLTVGVQGTTIRTIIQKNATEEKLKEVISHNLLSLEHMIDYNIQQGIQLFRISSGLIPFGSSPVNQLAWKELYREKFQRIGKKIKESGIRISFHPGQYTVLNSPDERVVERAVADLEYHADMLEALGTDITHKLILHIGGVYGDKAAAMERFINTYNQLADRLKSRLVIENDDRLYTIEDVLEISERCSIPVVYDNLHNFINPSEPSRDDADWINQAAATWKKKDGRQKIHYSQQDPGKRPGAHTPTIYLDAFLEFYSRIPAQDIDIMLEVKDKNLSALKCILAVREKFNIQQLEQEWARYKYAVLEKSPALYQEIRQLLKNKTRESIRPFYTRVEQIYTLPENPGYAENAALHVWGYFKNNATRNEERSFRQKLAKYREGTLSLEALKRFLWRLAEKYKAEYLLESLYFSF